MLTSVRRIQPDNCSFCHFLTLPYPDQPNCLVDKFRQIQKSIIQSLVSCVVDRRPLCFTVGSPTELTGAPPAPVLSTHFTAGCTYPGGYTTAQYQLLPISIPVLQALKHISNSKLKMLRNSVNNHSSLKICIDNPPKAKKVNKNLESQ